MPGCVHVYVLSSMLVDQSRETFYALRNESFREWFYFSVTRGDDFCFLSRRAVWFPREYVTDTRSHLHVIEFFCIMKAVPCTQQFPGKELWTALALKSLPAFLQDLGSSSVTASFPWPAPSQHDPKELAVFSLCSLALGGNCHFARDQWQATRVHGFREGRRGSGASCACVSHSSPRAAPGTCEIRPGGVLRFAQLQA